MELPGLLLVRVPEHLADSIAVHQKFAEKFRTVLLDQFPRTMTSNLEAFYVDPPKSNKTLELLSEIVVNHGITHAIVLTPLSEFGEGVKAALEILGVEAIWSEVFPGDRLLLDRLGCQYTEENEIDLFEPTAPELEPDLPIGTRFPQPPERSPAEIRASNGYDAVVVLGQVPRDHSLLGQEGPGYLEWLDFVFRTNPETTFLFKQHPASKTNPAAWTPGIEHYLNVYQIDESVHSLFQTYDAFLSYGSTTVLEGVSRGLSFATCGRHFVDSEQLVLRIQTPEEAEGLIGKIRGFRPDPAALRRRLSFLTRHYSFKPFDLRIGDRLTSSSDVFFSPAVQVASPAQPETP